MDRDGDLREHCRLLCQFVPNIIVQQLSEGGIEDDGPPTDEVPQSRKELACILALEVTGLSKWGSARVASADIVSPMGEEVSRFEDIFCMIADCAHVNGGDLLSMRNDQLIFSWSRGQGVDDMSEATKRALHAASQMLSRVGKRSKRKYLSAARASVSTGEIDFVFTGDPKAKKERIFFVPKGKTYVSAVTGLKDANDDEIVVDASTWTHMRLKSVFGPPLKTTSRGSAVLSFKNFTKRMTPKYKTVSLYDPIAKLKRDELDDMESEMMFFVPSPILEVLTHEGPDEEKWANDRRMEACVVRTRVQAQSPFTMDIMHEIVLDVQRIIGFYGGELLDVAQEGDEMTFLSCFGLPTELHEDDAERAILATLKIRAQLRSHPARSTIATGPIFCGCIGRGNSKRYAILGQPRIRSDAMMRSLTSTGPVIVCDAATREEVEEGGGELEFEALEPGTLSGVRGDMFVPYKQKLGMNSVAWHAAAVKALEAQLQHRRDHWFKLTHKNQDPEAGIVKMKVHLTGDGAIGRTNLADEIQRWLSSRRFSGRFFSLEGGLGHGKSEILRHTVLDVSKKHGSLKIGFIDADPLNKQDFGALSTFGSLIYDVFLRDGLKSGAEIHKRLVAMLKACGRHFEDLISWISIINPVFPVDIPGASDKVVEYLKAREDEIDTRGQMHQLVESTQRAVMLGTVWALCHAQPLLLCIDDALDSDARSLELVHDLVDGGTGIVSQYSTLCPGVTNFLIKECTDASKRKRKVCVVMAMHPLEEVEDMMSPEITTTLKMCFGDASDSRNSFTRLLVPLLTEEETGDLFMRELHSRGKFSDVKMLNAASRKKIFTQSEGNPIFVKEIAHEALEAYKTNDKIFSVKVQSLCLGKMEAQDLGLPASLEIKLGIEIDHQHLAAQLVLKIIAVANRPLTFAEIYHAFPLEHHKDELPSEIVHLIENDFIFDISKRKVKNLSSISKEMLFMRFWFTTEFMHHAIERRLLLEQSKRIKRVMAKNAGEEMKVPSHVFDDHSCSTEWGGEWGAEEMWRKKKAKMQRDSATKSDLK